MNNRTINVADDATITLTVTAQEDGTFYWSARQKASQRSVAKPFHRYVSPHVCDRSEYGSAPTVVEAVHAAEAKAKEMQERLIRAYHEHEAQLEIDRKNVEAADSAWE